MYNKKLGVVLVLVLLVQFSCAAHYITGFVEDALDGEGADGKNIVIWNRNIGILDNLTDEVGPGGNSGVNNVYMIDCELLLNGCDIGDNFSAKIYGDTYVSWVENFTIGGGGYDVVENLSLNSPPSSSLIFPNDGVNVSADVGFNCSFFDYDDNFKSVGLWGNWSGEWGENESRSIGVSGFEIFNKILTQGNYKWNCLVEDELGIKSFSEDNYSFFVDATAPEVWNVVVEDWSVCGFGMIDVNCSASDTDLEIGSVIIQSISPGNSLVNYSASFLSGNTYGVSVNVDEIGGWSFECFANDSVGNLNSSTSAPITVGSGNPEIEIVGDISFDKTPSTEGEIINVSVNISNSGCVGSGDFVVGFSDGVNFENKTISIGAYSFNESWALWTTKIGLWNISVYVDLLNNASEDNETNNEANDSLYLGAWQGIYGNMSLDKVLRGRNSNVSYWIGESVFEGCIFIADSESEIEWNELLAIGRTISGAPSSDDFSEIDSVLGMGNLNDSVYDIFSSSEVRTFNVFQEEIADVPFVNSSAGSSFVTGILWDSGDSGDLEYDSFEKEDLVFVTELNRGGVGGYGTYDYEINIPVRLRNYDSADESLVYLYYDLN